MTQPAFPATPKLPLPPAYPETVRGSQVDAYHGTSVADPYRWLEDDRSPETEAWVQAQNAVTYEWLDQIPWRSQLRDRITHLVDYPRIGQPHEQAGLVFFAKNDGLQNQSVWYIQRGLHGDAHVLIDPNTLSEDGTTRVGLLSMNKAGTHVAYTVSHAGSDWQEIRIRALDTREDLRDVVQWVKVSGIAWWNEGFFYSRYPAPTESAFSEMNDRHQVWYHTMGTAQSDDKLIFDDDVHPQRFHTVDTTDDERFAILYISDRGQGKDGDAISVMDLRTDSPVFTPLWAEFDDQFRVVDNVDDTLLVFSTRGAPNGCVLRVPATARSEAEWQVIVPERAEPLQDVSTCGERVFAHYLMNVTTTVREFTLDGSDERVVALPGRGTASGFSGERGSTRAFYTFTSFTAPPTVYSYALSTRESTVFQAPELSFDPTQFETHQVFATSRDGTRVPMFLVHQRGLKRDGQNATLAYGYGGFNVTLLPAFSAARVAFLEQGGVYVQMNLRGGGEYGEAWHRGGMKRAKQNVFDDAIACLEWLITNGYTSPAKLAVQGGSNGGLLVGALMTQRPDLFRVALPSVGVMDMLRFHKFTIGWNWIADYGSSDDSQEFAALHAYSPLHQLKEGTSYPATLITTGDHDDRVVPAHSFKFAAQLQHVQQGDAPVLIRVETQSGHGSSSLSKGIAELADVFSFLFVNLGVTPRESASTMERASQ